MTTSQGLPPVGSESWIGLPAPYVIASPGHETCFANGSRAGTSRSRDRSTVRLDMQTASLLRTDVSTISVVLNSLLVLAILSGCASKPSCARQSDTRLDSFTDNLDAARLIGRSRTEVVAEIGEPTSHRFDGDWDASYWLRPRKLCMDGWYLVIDYSVQETVEKAQLIPG